MGKKIKAEIEKAVERAVKSQQLELRRLQEKIALQEQKNLMLREENKQIKMQAQLKDQEINRLKMYIKELEVRLAKNSSNSNKPPSGDGLRKPSPKSQRKSTGRKTGGQIGHQGSTLEQVEKPDFIETQEVCLCERCGHSLKNEKLLGYEKRQEFELPPIKVQVTEYCSEIKRCSICGFINKAKFPKDITQPVQYGAQIKSMITYFSHGQLLPYERTQEIFRDLYELPLSEGTLVNTNLSCYAKLEGYEDRVKQLIKFSDVVSFDESGMRVKKQLQWLHVAATDKLTYYEIHEKRGSEAMDAIGILPEFTGRAIHDHWKPYFNYQCKHGLCNAHHLREFVYHKEQYNQKWCGEMGTLLLKIKDEIDECKISGKDKLLPRRLHYFEDCFDNILSKGLKEIPQLNPKEPGKRGRKKQYPSMNLWKRLSEYKEEALAFTHNFAVPFTNNQGERDIRMAKLKQKISGCFRSKQGAKTFCRIRGYLSTVRKQEKNVLESLSLVFNGSPFMPGSDTS